MNTNVLGIIFLSMNSIREYTREMFCLLGLWNSDGQSPNRIREEKLPQMDEIKRAVHYIIDHNISTILCMQSLVSNLLVL